MTWSNLHFEKTGLVAMWRMNWRVKNAYNSNLSGNESSEFTLGLNW